MITCAWSLPTGWSPPTLLPHGPLSLAPTASSLHYATQCFEGLKFHRGHDGQLRLFRPLLNCHRMLKSAVRISLPAFPPAQLLKLITALVATDGEKWLPRSRPGAFLYLRPAMIATDPSLSPRVPEEALLVIVSTFFPSFDDPVPKPGQPKPEPGLKLLASKEDTVRAWPGGFGYAKVGANYGPSMVAQVEAKARGFNQILWLFGAGASNFIVVWKTREGKKELITAPLGDKLILEGITRRSVLELARERLAEELDVVERKYGITEVEEAVEEGRMLEAFVVGTAVRASFLCLHFSTSRPLIPHFYPSSLVAAVADFSSQYFIAPVSLIHSRGKDLAIPLSAGESGPYAKMLKHWLREIVYGDVQHGWGVVVEEKSFGSTA